MPELSICIVNWNTRALLLQTLKSVFDTAGDLALEVIVVDNASTDGSADAARLAFPSVHLICNTANVGFARANNQAFAIARGEWLLLLNSDTIVRPGAMQAMLTFARSRQDAGVVGCKLLNADGTLQPSWAAFPSLASEMLGKNFRRRQLVQSSPRAYSVDWVTGAVMLVLRKVYQHVGGLDESFFMYSEETEWCYRIKKVGWSVYYLEDAEILHIGSASASISSGTQLIRLYDSKLRYYARLHGRHHVALLRTGMAVVNSFGLIRRYARCMFRERSLSVCRERTAGKVELLRWLVSGTPQVSAPYTYRTRNHAAAASTSGAHGTDAVSRQ